MVRELLIKAKNRLFIITDSSRYQDWIEELILYGGQDYFTKSSTSLHFSRYYHDLNFFIQDKCFRSIYKMSSNDADEATNSSSSQNFFQPKEELVSLIIDLGFSRNAAIRALFYTGNQSADLAAGWLLENNDRNVDTPLEMDLQGTSESSDDEDFMTSDAYKMVFVVNSELNMGVGKLAAQVAHAALSLFRKIMEDDSKAFLLMAWGHMGEMKIVLRGESTLQLEALEGQAALLGLDHHIVHDAGLTQVAAGSCTVLGIFGKVEDVDRVTGNLKLL